MGSEPPRQFHFWKPATGPGRDAWDVHRLIELSRELPIEQTALNDIGEIDSVYWFDGETHRPTVRSVVEHAERIRTVDPDHPILLGPDGRVMDGMHRVARALLEGRRTIGARRFTELPEPDHRNIDPASLADD